MKLFLIRHAECEHNVGQALGNADNLTRVGQEQARQLARYLSDRPVRFTRVLSSDLDRATDTARVICKHQMENGPVLEPFRTAKLREQCFGCGGLSMDVTHIESMASMRARVHGVLRDHILPEMANRVKSRGAVIGVVGHAIILQVFWACLTDLFGSQSFHLARDATWMGSNYMRPKWSNTGIMELDIRPGGPPEEMLLENAVQVNVQPPWLTKSTPPVTPDGSAPLIGWSVTILTVDSTPHLTVETQAAPKIMPFSRQPLMAESYRVPGARVAW
ncbi:hypothetical protein N7462_002845 [Penicillium macrosclerotiorum]|uniref:uncharacterized protein n=1 Tax=Penicillium macrosclerotiorum TaxID=303699 RepID=UPI002547AACB|nr:uncharacterized protein N7462_002845 [Penicillium macrosclerotiorum]KAJ5693422.1 hypothetical protein N7462_002845 [Penicillium macrosclerotiorum]